MKNRADQLVLSYLRNSLHLRSIPVCLALLHKLSMSRSQKKKLPCVRSSAVKIFKYIKWTTEKVLQVALKHEDLNFDLFEIFILISLHYSKFKTGNTKRTIGSGPLSYPSKMFDFDSKLKPGVKGLPAVGSNPSTVPLNQWPVQRRPLKCHLSRQSLSVHRWHVHLDA